MNWEDDQAVHPESEDHSINLCVSVAQKATLTLGSAPCVHGPYLFSKSSPSVQFTARRAFGDSLPSGTDSLLSLSVAIEKGRKESCVVRRSDPTE